ncbi:MAG: efflux RND transporter permease subunit [Elusimicrobiota bacterium]
MHWLSYWSLRWTRVVLACAIALLLMGLFAYHNLDIEAYPDPIQPTVEVITQPLGLSAEEVEKIVTIPIEYGLAGMSGLESIRSISLFGLSDVKCYFNWGTQKEWDDVLTTSRLSTLTLPQGLTAQISPENPIGEIYRYVLRTPNHDLMLEKEIEDWVVEKQLKTVPGVVDVAGFGGLTKEYHVDVDPYKLNFYGLSLSNLIAAIQNSNANAGGNYLSLGEQNVNIRSIGFIRSPSDIGQITLSAPHATPVRVQDVADAGVGYAPRLGVVGKDDDNDVVEGIVLMRKGGDTEKTLAAVKAKVDELNKILPNGARIEPYYDRSALVRTTVRTVMENLSVGVVLVFLVLLFFLTDFRAALIATANIPLALCAAFILMVVTGTPANLISLGAIDFGIIIDSTVIMLENIHRHSTESKGSLLALDIVMDAAREVGGPILFSTLIFIVAFLPLFTMQGAEGAIFSPMSHAYAYALGAAILLAVTLTPVLAATTYGRGYHETKNPAWNAISRFYHGLIVRSLVRPGRTLAILGVVVAAILCLLPFLGGQFLPKLEEGNIWARATLPLDVSFDHSARTASRVRRIFLSYPEVRQVVSQTGRPDDGTDTAGFYNIEFSVDLKPEKEWPGGVSKEKLVATMDDQLQKEFPGVSFGYSQNIEDNVEEALSGVKGENSVKVFGPELQADEDTASKVKKILDGTPGMADTAVYRSLGQPNLLIIPDRAKCARYGLNVGDVAAVVQGAVGGQSVTQVLEGDRSFGLIVRWKPQFRQSIDAIRGIRVTLPTGSQVPLSQIAVIQMSEGASYIYREGLERFVPVRFSVRGQDLQSTVLEAQKRVASSVALPPGTHLVWSGEYGELNAAKKRLFIIVPITLILIGMLLYGATASWVDTSIIFVQIPVACLGGVVALFLTGVPFSISAAVGFISIFGIAVMDGMLINSYVRQLWREGQSLTGGIVSAMDRRLRAVMMTAFVDGLGLLPAALSTKIGAQAQRPLAIVVIGGCLAIITLTRVLQPALIYLGHLHFGVHKRPEGAEGRA